MALSSQDLLSYLQQKMGVDIADLDDETLLYSSGLLDSFSMVDMLMFIEAKANIRIRSEDVTLDNLDSISRIINMVNSYNQQPNHSAIS